MSGFLELDWLEPRLGNCGGWSRIEGKKFEVEGKKMEVEGLNVEVK